MTYSMLHRFHQKLSGSRLFIALLACLAIITACEGDSRPFEEAAVVQSLELTSVAITLPRLETLLAASLETENEFVIATGQSLPLGISAVSAVQGNIILSANDRRWESNNTSFLSVDEDGVITGVAEGQAQVRVAIGGVEAAPVSVRVSDMPLLSIESINSLRDLDSIDRCLPAEFYAVGLFQGNSMRPLYNATYRVSDNTGSTVTKTDDSTALLNAVSPDALTLTASVTGVDPFERQFTVASSLGSISIAPGSASISVDESVQFTATGNYSVAGQTGNSRAQDITSSVQWQIVSGEQNISLNTDGDNIGRATGLDEGTATVQASCGSAPVQNVEITVAEDTTSGSDELSFNEGTVLRLLVGQTAQLEVSQGNDFDDDNTITDDVVFSISDSSTTTSPISLAAIETGFVRGLATGEVTVTATLNDNDGGVEASGSITVRISGS